MFDLSRKVILIAGGAGYLGRAICEGLSQQGANLMIADIALDRAEALAGHLSSAGGEARALELDAGDENSIFRAVNKTVEQYGRIDVLINSTFSSTGKSLNEVTSEEFNRANSVNLTGAFVLARAAAEYMKQGGSIIFFASMYGRVAPDPRIYKTPMNPNPIEYGVGKAGLIQMTKYLAVSWGQRNIRVNAIAPGPFPNHEVQRDHPEFVKRLAEKVPLGRIGSQQEMAGAVVFLASDDSSFLSGATINIDGGWTAW